MTKSKTFTTAEVARLCHVSDATVKRWQDAGLLKSERTSGGHRRFRLTEIARFQREKNLGQKLRHGEESVFAATTRLSELKAKPDYDLFDSLLGGCEETAADFLIDAHLGGKSLNEIFDEMICPPMRKIGRLWFENEISIAREHLATRAAQNALFKLRGVLPVPEPRGKLAFCCAVEGEFHELPTHMAQMICEDEGWEVLNFGANTPLYCLVEEYEKHAPDVVCISATMPNNVERLARDYDEFRRRTKNLSVVLGGRMFVDKEAQKRFPAELYAQSLRELTDYIRRLSKL